MQAKIHLLLSAVLIASLTHIPISQALSPSSSYPLESYPYPQHKLSHPMLNIQGSMMPGIHHLVNVLPSSFIATSPLASSSFLTKSTLILCSLAGAGMTVHGARKRIIARSAADAYAATVSVANAQDAKHRAETAQAQLAQTELIEKIAAAKKNALRFSTSELEVTQVCDMARKATLEARKHTLRVEDNVRTAARAAQTAAAAQKKLATIIQTTELNKADLVAAARETARKAAAIAEIEAAEATNGVATAATAAAILQAYNHSATQAQTIEDGKMAAREVRTQLVSLLASHMLSQPKVSAVSYDNDITAIKGIYYSGKTLVKEAQEAETKVCAAVLQSKYRHDEITSIIEQFEQSLKEKHTSRRLTETVKQQILKFLTLKETWQKVVEASVIKTSLAVSTAVAAQKALEDAIITNKEAPIREKHINTLIIARTNAMEGAAKALKAQETLTMILHELKQLIAHV